MIDLIRQVKIYIQNNMAYIRYSTDIAHAIGFSYETLRKKFRKEEGISLGRYLTLQRVETAKLLLQTTELKCYEICHRVGFPCQVTGCRIFKKYTGWSMAEYRQIFQKKNNMPDNALQEKGALIW